MSGYTAETIKPVDAPGPCVHVGIITMTLVCVPQPPNLRASVKWDDTPFLMGPLPHGEMPIAADAVQ
jgi:hypothetical protein